MQSFHLLAVRFRIALDNALVALVGHILTDAVLVIGAKNALTLAAVFRIKLHHGVERRAGTCEEVKNYSIIKVGDRYQ